MGRLDGKVALITGGARGIGRAVAERMAKEGASIAVGDLHLKQADELVEKLIEQGHTACAWPLDVAKEVEVERFVSQAAVRLGRIDVLVNNAGVAGANRPTHEITEAEWDFVQAVNVKGVFFGTKHVVPHMRRAGGGSIINLSSIYGVVGAGDVPPYHASKGAVRLMSKNDALIYAPDRIRVNSVHPGFIWTPMVEGFAAELGDVATVRRELDERHPLGHIGEPDDIAWACVYLGSDEAKFVTGAELVIDGGYTAR